MLMQKTLKNGFHRAGHALTDVFVRAALSKPGDFVIRHAGAVSAISFFAGDLAYGIKHIVPALTFVLSDAFLWASDHVENPKFKKYLKHSLPAAGICTFSSAVMMSCLGWHEPGRAALLVSTSLIALQAVSWIFQNQFNRLTKEFSEKASGLLQKACTHPVISTTVLDLVGKAFMAASAIQQRSLPQLFATIFWSNADGHIVFKDDNFRAWLNSKKSSIPALS